MLCKEPSVSADFLQAEGHPGWLSGVLGMAAPCPLLLGGWGMQWGWWQACSLTSVTSYNGNSHLGRPGVTRTSKRRSLEPVCLHCREFFFCTAFGTEMGILLILGEGGLSLEYVFNLFSAPSF